MVYYKLYDRGKERGLYFDVISRENDITLGTAIGGLL